MSLVLIAIVSIIGIILGKLLFVKWFNHLTLYCIIFGGALYLYELKLLPYDDIVPFAWFIMISSFLSFFFGILTIMSARNLFDKKVKLKKKESISLPIFADGGKTIKYSTLILSLIGLYAAIEYWMILIHQFGSIPAVFLNANVIYHLNMKSQIKGATPFIFLVAYVAVFFSAIYTAYRGKFTLLSFFPLVSIILKDIGTNGRVSSFMAIMEFIITLILFRYLLSNDISSGYKFSIKNAVLASAILIILFVGSASLVKVTRNLGGTTEEFSGQSSTLRQMKGNFIVSPSIYLYFSCDIGVLSKYFASEGENTGFGENTLMTFYILLTKFDIIKKPNQFQKGYFIPMWVNTGTYLRELHADFGMFGVFVIPYLLGLLCTFLWFKFYENKNLNVFAVLVFLYLIVGFSFFVMATRVLYWATGLGMILICNPIFEKIACLIGGKSIEK